MVELLIRAVSVDDAVALQHLFNQPDAYSQTLHLPHTDQAQWQERLQTKAGSHKLVAVLDGQVVGLIELAVEQAFRRRHVGNIGLGVHPAFTRQGIGARLLAKALHLADDWLNLQRLELTVFTDNVGAIALYEKMGFEIEGTSRRYAFRAGVYEDVYQMARCR